MNICTNVLGDGAWRIARSEMDATSIFVQMYNARMENTDIPDDLRHFIVQTIPSVPCLEALLLMHKVPAHTWDRQQIARSLYLDEKAADAVLHDLVATGFINADLKIPGCYRFNRPVPELSQMIERIATLYAHNLVGVTTLIHSRIDENAQQFASAFLLRHGH
jgi:hypothetical protein